MDGALIAMSGGVDSSVAALLAVEQGLCCAGGMMKLFDEKITSEGQEDTASPPADVADAEAVSKKLGIPFHIFDLAEAFEKYVIDRFIQAYQNGETPNPCIDCNRHLKFGCLYERAKELGKEYIVTGHYARIEADKTSGRCLLKKGIDPSKDQSYVLYTLTQEQLRHTLFPLGGLTKAQVREIANEHGFTNAKKQESQDICFIRDGNYADFIREHTGKENDKGRFIDTAGNVLGENKGIIYYTIGQRKGLGLSAATPLYVCSISAKDNTVVVGTEDELYSKRLTAGNINLIPTDSLDVPIKVRAKVRYKQPEQPATVQQLDKDTLMIEFDEPQRAITKGQSVVLYDGDIVVGGGKIKVVCK